MLVEKGMSKNPETIAPEDYLADALVKMHKGGFRRLPVVKDGKLVGIITDRDLREHARLLQRTRTSSAMTKDLLTVTPRTTLEQAAKLMLSHKISGFPVTDAGKFVRNYHDKRSSSGVSRRHGRFRRRIFPHRLRPRTRA